MKKWGKKTKKRQRLQHSPEDFGLLLTCDAHEQQLLKICRARGCEELVHFLLSSRTACTVSHRVWIYHRYIRAGAVDEINVSPKARSEARLGNLQPAIDEVKSLIKLNFNGIF